MARIVLDASDLDHLGTVFRDVAADLRYEADYVRSHTRHTFLNYRDSRIARTQPDAQSVTITRSIISLSGQVEADRHEIQRILGQTRADLGRGWDGSDVLRVSEGAQILLEILAHISAYQAWFKSIEDYHQFLGYVDSAWSGVAGGLLQLAALTGDTEIHELAGLAGRTIDLAVDGAQWLRHGSAAKGALNWIWRDAHRIPHGFHAASHALGAGAAVIGAPLGAIRAWNAFGQGDTLGGISGVASAGASLLYFVPGAQGLALGLTAVSLGIDAYQWTQRNWGDITRIGGNIVSGAANLAGDVVTGAGRLISGATSIATNVVTAPFRGLRSLFD